MKNTDIRMPMQLPQSTGLQRHNGRRDSSSNGEVAGINNRQRTSLARSFRDRLLGKMVDVGTIAFQLSVRACDISLADIALDDVRVWRRYGVEDGFVDPKILG